jgi:hypothetical protein
MQNSARPARPCLLMSLTSTRERRRRRSPAVFRPFARSRCAVSGTGFWLRVSPPICAMRLLRPDGAGTTASEVCQQRRNHRARRRVVASSAEPQKTDRYGRVVAYALRDGTEHSAQADLVAAGGARSARSRQPGTCCRTFEPRKHRALGLWASPYYDLLNTDSPADALAEQGPFCAGRGQCGVCARERRHNLCEAAVNEDFTVTISKRNERSSRYRASTLAAVSGTRLDRAPLDRSGAARTDRVCRSRMSAIWQSGG